MGRSEPLNCRDYAAQIKLYSIARERAALWKWAEAIDISKLAGQASSKHELHIDFF